MMLAQKQSETHNTRSRLYQKTATGTFIDPGTVSTFVMSGCPDVVVLGGSGAGGHDLTTTLANGRRQDIATAGVVA